ncbi:hypothetical protein ACN082_01730 [Rothia sp. CCM 9417]|uniref:hypothetical protein n=1 Tax=unclassified Rothia (in: high G+C Gram-positive bacteria) TaxID=2689056 RepID=UPI003AE43856
MAPQFESPRNASDQEFTYMAVGMIAGAVPGIVIGLLIALLVGHAAMWVSITGGVGIVIGLLISRALYRKKQKKLP